MRSPGLSEPCSTEVGPFVVAGDWHGDQAWALAVIRNAARAGASTILHVGDFAFDWPGPKRNRYENRLNQLLSDEDINLIVSGGNHDNWDTISRMTPGPEGVAFFRSNIAIIPRGGRTQIHGLTVGALGGAFSVDREHRTLAKDWWANEEPTEEEAQRLVNEGRVDILITHDAPVGVPLWSQFSFPPEIDSQANRTRTLLGRTVASLTPPHVFCGHWHQRVTHEIVHPGGVVTRVDVLDKEYSRGGNAVLIRPSAASLDIEPLMVEGG